jgi:ABC-type sugar transport system substrate-binding protein
MPPVRRAPRAARRVIGLAGVAAASAALAAGCGSSGSTIGSSGAGAATGGSSAKVRQAEQMVADASRRPTAISVTKPIGKPVPTGQKIVFISCGVAQCVLQGKIVADIARLLGWTSSTIATDGSPTQIQAAYETAIRQGVDAIVTTAASRVLLQAQIPKLKAKGIVISDASSTDPVAPPFIYNTSTVEQNARIGKSMAAEIVADSKAKANVLYVNLPAYTILAALGKSFEQVYKDLCPDCSYASIDIPLPRLADAPNQIVSYLRSHPSVNYVALSVADALDSGLPAALKVAGLSHVKIVGEGGGPTSFSYLAGGQELALVPFDYFASDFQMMDALARHFAGVPVAMTAIPLWLVTKSNLPGNHVDLFPNVLDYKSQFLKLWGKS